MPSLQKKYYWNKNFKTNIFINKLDTLLVSWQTHHPYCLKWYIIRKYFYTNDTIFAHLPDGGLVSEKTLKWLWTTYCTVSFILSQIWKILFAPKNVFQESHWHNFHLSLGPLCWAYVFYKKIMTTNSKTWYVISEPKMTELPQNRSLFKKPLMQFLCASWPLSL